MKKTCTKCGVPQARAAFRKQSAKRDGLHSWCRLCFSRYEKKKRRDDPEASRRRVRAWRGRNLLAERSRVETYRKANPKKVRAYQLKSKFGITQDEYQARLRKQRGGCAICHVKDPGNKHGTQTFAVDHDHKSGTVRGLLCQRHNLMLGFAGDSEEVLAASIEYLRKWRQSRGV